MQKMDANSTVEKFGTMINTSFFESANMLGTLKVKGYIEIESSIGGNSKISLTEAGASILQNAVGKDEDPVDALDNAVMKTLASGIRDLDKLQEALNIRSSDLAYHLHKLEKQGFVHYDVRSAKVNLALTEKGFNLTGGFRAVEQRGPVGEAEKEAHEIIKTSMPASPAGVQTAKAPSSPAPGAPPWANLGKLLGGKPAQKSAIPEAAKAPQPTASASTGAQVAQIAQPVQPVAQKAPSQAESAVAVQAATQTTLAQGQKPATKGDMALSKYSFYAQKYAIVIVFGILLGLVAGYLFFLQGKI
jgi:DNA-binding HxlR family transcriptional regulator